MSHGRDRVPAALKNNEIVLGWSEAIGLIETEQWRAFRAIIHKRYHANESNYRKAGRAAGDAYRFVHDMAPGTWVVVPAPGKFYVAEVIGPTTYDPARVKDDSAYTRKVRWLNGGKPIPRSIARAALQSRMKIQGTTADATDLIDEIIDALETQTGEGPAPPHFDSDLRQKLVQEALKEIRTGRIESYGFEHLCAAILRATGGQQVRVVPRSLDKGADVTAEFRLAGAIAVRVAVQAKHYRGTEGVNKEVVDKLIQGMDAEDAHYGIIMTSGIFADDVEPYVRELEENENRRIELVDGQQLAALVVDYGLSAVTRKARAPEGGPLA